MNGTLAIAEFISAGKVPVAARHGRTVSERADGARGYPGRLTDDEVNTKFLACAQRSLTQGASVQVLDLLRTIETTPNIAALTQLCSIG